MENPFYDSPATKNRKNTKEHFKKKEKKKERLENGVWYLKHVFWFLHVLATSTKRLTVFAFYHNFAITSTINHKRKKLLKNILY